MIRSIEGTSAAAVLLLLGALPSSEVAAAVEEAITCELDGLTRHVILRSDPEPGRVCDVLYRKPDEDAGDRVAWFARNDAEYCAPRSRELVDRLAATGWTCGYADGDDVVAAGTTGAAGGTDTVASDGDEARTAAGEATAAGGRERFRSWCVADASDVSGAADAASRCDCMLESLTSQGVSDEGLTRIADGIVDPIASSDTGSAATRSKYLNTLAVSYAESSDRCR